jgi:hypothetical protein
VDIPPGFGLGFSGLLSETLNLAWAQWHSLFLAR